LLGAGGEVPIGSKGEWGSIPKKRSLCNLKGGGRREGKTERENHLFKASAREDLAEGGGHIANLKGQKRGEVERDQRWEKPVE